MTQLSFTLDSGELSTNLLLQMDFHLKLVEVRTSIGVDLPSTCLLDHYLVPDKPKIKGSTLKIGLMSRKLWPTFDDEGKSFLSLGGQIELAVL